MECDFECVPQLDGILPASEYGSTLDLINNNDKLSIICVNIENLSKKRDSVEMSDLLELGNIVGFVETWQSKKIQLNGFTEVGFEPAIRQTKKGRLSGGVAVYCRNEISDNVECLNDSHKLENTWIRIKSQQTTLRACFVYRQPVLSNFAKTNFYKNL